VACCISKNLKGFINMNKYSKKTAILLVLIACLFLNCFMQKEIAHPTTVSDYYVNGMYYYDVKGDIDRAIDSYTKSIEIDSLHRAGPFEARGAMYIRKGDYKKALKDWDSSIVLSKSTRFVAPYIDRAQYYLFMGDTARAIVDLSSAIDIDSLNYDALYYRGKIYLSNGNYKNAMNDFNQAITYEGTFIEDLYICRGKIY
jgi:tetratricopeptide (TPR) repeat protein